MKVYSMQTQFFFQKSSSELNPEDLPGSFPLKDCFEACAAFRNALCFDFVTAAAAFAPEAELFLDTNRPRSTASEVLGRPPA